MPASKHFALFQTVGGAAVGALGLAGVGHIQVDLGVAAPQLHVGLGAGTVDAALGIQFFGGQFYNGSRTHIRCLSHKGVEFTPGSTRGRIWNCVR